VHADETVNLPSPVSWQSFEVAEGVVVNVRGDLAPWRSKQVRDALTEFVAKLKE
jgi:hypothetical protein